MSADPRSRAQRRHDTEHRLHHDVDLWVASAAADGAPYLVPLSFDWDGETLLMATPTDSPTGHLAATRTVRLGLGDTRDVSMIEGDVEVLVIDALPRERGDQFAARTGFDPRLLATPYRWFRVSPRRIQAWREANELEGRELMRDGRWLIDERSIRSFRRRTHEMAQKTAKRAAATGEGFTTEERAAMKERAKEAKAEARANKNRADGEHDVLAKIAEMPEPDRVMAERLHAIVTANAPSLWPKTWYGMPAYAKDGKVLCFFQAAAKFGARYATFGFNDIANLDDGTMWPTAFALMELTADDEARIAALVKKAVS